ncbi:MAG: hypothetical protein LQ340_000837 [Diploschistes diacapsis]|nr:MAG: hypothetical protein LQ340_000837 [Diploschistes diacapsis]
MLGGQTVLIQGDVSKLDDVRRAFDSATAPVDGIINGAMVLKIIQQDKIVGSMSIAEFKDVSLQNLSGVIGQKGQANYAAANAFLDSFAAYHVGYIAGNDELAARLDRNTWAAGINEARLHEILSRAILTRLHTKPSTSANSQLITGIPIPLPETSELLTDARFRGLCFGADDGAGHLLKQGARLDRDSLSHELQALSLLITSAKKTQDGKSQDPA